MHTATISVKRGLEFKGEYGRYMGGFKGSGEEREKYCN